MKSHGEELRFFLAVLAVAVLATGALAETVYVDARNGSDKNTGTKDNPVQTIGRAAEMVNSRTEPGPTIIKISPGIYNLTESVEFGGTLSFTEKERLGIEASVFPGYP